MAEAEKGLLFTSATSETIVAHDVGETLDGSVECGGQVHDEVICGDSVKGAGAVAVAHPVTSLFAEMLETIDSILYMPIGGNDNIDDIEEMPNFVDDKFDAKSNIVDIVETIDLILNMPIGNDKVDGKANIVDEVVCGTEVEKCNAKEQIIADNDVSGVSALNAEQSDVLEGMLIDVEDQQGTERSKTMEQTAKVKGLSAAIGSEEIFDVNAIVEKDTQITEQWSHVLLHDGKEKLGEESNMRQKVVEKECVSEQVGSDGGREIEEEFNEAGKRKLTYGKAVKDALVKPGSSEIVHQARYLLPAVKKEGEFSFSDMVWGKVKTYPWWPGQIFDPSDASEWAMKHYKKDCYFVAYFGDKSFAWNEASQLKDFRAHFSTMEKQRSRLESFQNAIDCALDEVSRRVEYGLACSCIPKDTYDTIKSQTVDNTGIRQEISITRGVDESQNVDSFSPMKLIEYVKTLSELPTSGLDRLELEIAKAQLLAFNRFKSFSCFQEIQRCGGVDKDNLFFVDDEQDLCEVIEHATPVVNTEDQAGPRNLKNQSTHQKRKCNFKDAMHLAKKEKRMSDPMNGTPDSRDGDCWTPDHLVSPEHSKRRSAIDHFDDDFEMQTREKTIPVAKVSNTPNSSLKIGDCIRRAASQLIPKKDGVVDVFPENELDVSPTTVEYDESTTEYSSLDDMLSSLQCVAQKPLGEYTFLNGIVTFFSDFKNSVIVAADWKEISCTDEVGTKKMKKLPMAGTGSDTFEFEDMSDSNWTDRVIDNDNEKKSVQHPLQKNQKKDKLLVAAKSPKPAVKSPEPPQVIRRPYSWEKKSENNHAEAPEKPPGYIDENASAELVMNFAEVNSVPSKTNLNQMFRRFGRLKESDTEIDRVSKRARVVFKKCVDAKVALSSAKKFNIFGSVLVDYQLNYTPSAVFKAFSKKHD